MNTLYLGKVDRVKRRIRGMGWVEVADWGVPVSSLFPPQPCREEEVPPPFGCLQL